jgi:exonuclease III
MRLLSWNIRQGGGKRLDQIGMAIDSHDPDVVVLNEARARTIPLLAKTLAVSGLRYHEHTSPTGIEYGTLIAARTPLRQLPRRGPSRILPHGLLEVELEDWCTIGGVYGPMVTPKHRRFWNSVVRHAAANVHRPYLFIGDFNTCEAGVDAYKKPLAGSEQFVAIRDAGFVDLWRRSNSTTEYTWFSFGRAGVPLNGFRIDHALASPVLASQATSCRYSHGERETRISDHSMLIVEFET